MIIGDEQAVYHVVSRTALDGLAMSKEIFCWVKSSGLPAFIFAKSWGFHAGGSAAVQNAVFYGFRRDRVKGVRFG